MIVKTKVAYLIRPRCFEIREEEIRPGAGQVLIKLAVCALCNHELNNWEGLSGEYPMRLGHEAAGTVVEIGEGVKNLKVGDKVTGAIWNAFSEYMVADENGLYRLKDTIDPKYAFSEPLKCVTTVLRDTAPEAGDYGVVMGCGPMGLWCIQALKGSLLAGLIAVDISPEHLEFAKIFGATHVINSAEEDVKEKIARITGNHMADFVIEGTGDGKIVDQSMNYLRKLGRLVVMSSFKKPADFFDLRVAVAKGIRIVVAHGSATQADDWRRAVKLINNGTFKIKEIVTHEFCLDEVNTAFQMLENKPKGYIKGLIKFDCSAG